MDREKLVYATVGTLSFIVILIELLQTRILSFIFWNHIVYLATSIALLGFGISGTIIATGKITTSNAEQLVPKLLCGLGLSLAGGYLGTVMLPLMSLGLSPLKILSCYCLYLMPFVFAGAVLSLLFARAQVDVRKLYAVDLLLAGLACICFFFLLPLLGAVRLLGASITIVGMLSFCWTNSQSKALKLLASSVIEIGAVMLIFPLQNMLPLLPEPYKEFNQEMTIPGAVVEKTVWTPLCRIDVIGNKTKSKGTQWPFRADQYKILTQDGTAHTRILSKSGIELLTKMTHEGVQNHISSIILAAKPNSKVAIIGLGGGDDVARALANNAKAIYGAELNPVTYKYLVDDYSDYRGHLYDRPNVFLRNEEGRSMMRGLKEPVDVLEINGIDTFAAQSSGAYMLSENYLYTVEAIREFLSKLAPDGVISETRWTGTEALRLVSLLCEGLKSTDHKELGKEMFVILDHEGWVNVMAKKEPFTEAEVKAIVQSLSKLHISIMYLPKVMAPPQSALLSSTVGSSTSIENAKLSKDIADLIDAYDHNTEKSFFAQYPQLVSPTYDDQPFFFEYGSRTSLGLPQLDKLRGTAMSALLAVIALSTVATVVAIFLPLWKFSKDGIGVPGATQLSVFFTSVGFAFMLMEIGLMQKCVLFLGNPLYSLSVVLATLLLSAGSGSALATRLQWDLKKTVTIFGSAFVTVAIILILALNTFMYNLMTEPLLLRMLCTFLILFPIGMLMGMFFPTGLQLVRQRSESYLPWAWGMNGCSSVYGSFAAILLAIYYGFTVTLFAGVAVYIAGFFAAASAFQVLQASKGSTNS